MKEVILVLTVLFLTLSGFAQGKIEVVCDSLGSRLTIDGKPFFLYELIPRKAYEALRSIHGIDPYQSTPTAIVQYFDIVRNQIKE